ncbi:hypothetical protein LguiA_014278 [Lonicera macranthoides]
MELVTGLVTRLCVTGLVIFMTDDIDANFDPPTGHWVFDDQPIGHWVFDVPPIRDSIGYTYKFDVDAQLDETIVSALLQQNRGVVIVDESERLQSFKKIKRRKLDAGYMGKGKGKENQCPSTTLTPPTKVNGLSRNVLGALARRLNDGTSRKNSYYSIQE